MGELVSGGNLVLPEGALTVRVPGPFDLSALVCGDDGKVAGDDDFVFYNQPSAPGARLDGDAITVDPRRLRAGASRVTVVVSPADPHVPLGRLPVPVVSVSGGGGGRLARFTPPRVTQETVLLLVEIYRRGGVWKLRALGQGYADGLAGIARDYGVQVLEDSAPVGEFGELVNSERARAGVPPLSLDAQLAAAAQAHAGEMAAAGRLGVESARGISVFQQVTTRGYAYVSIAEHLVSGPRTPAEFFDYCMASEQTRSPLVDPVFTAFGVAHVDAPTGTYWTALWARPLTADGLARTASEVIALTNAERAAAGLRPLVVDQRLTAAAQAHSADMVTRGFYSHTSPDGSEPWDRARAAGATHRGIGENIACGQRSPAEVVQGWMNSPGHRANILKPDFTHIGIGYAGGGSAGSYWTQLFGLSP